MALGPNQIAGIAEGATGITAALGGAIYGAVKSGKLNRQQEKILQGQKDFNQNWWDVKNASDYTQRADVQATIKRMREMLNDRYNQARATNTVAGGTDESLALQKQAANQALSDTATNVAAATTAARDRDEQQYLNRKSALEDQERQNLQQRAAAVAQAASQTVNNGLNMVGHSFETFTSSPLKTNNG